MNCTAYRSDYGRLVAFIVLVCLYHRHSNRNMGVEMRRNIFNPSYCKCKIHLSQIDVGSKCEKCGMVIKTGTPSIRELEQWLKEKACLEQEEKSSNNE